MKDMIGGSNRVSYADSPARIFYHVGLEAGLHAVDGRGTHAVVIGQAGEKDSPQSAFPQIAGKPGAGDGMVLPKSRIGVDVRAEPLAQDQLRIVRLQVRVESSPHAPLHAMVGPQHLLAVSRRHGFKRSSPGMMRSKGMMIWWMPILGHDQVAKERGHAMDHGNHLLAAGHGEGASITEVILYVDHQQHIAVNQLYTHSF